MARRAKIDKDTWYDEFFDEKTGLCGICSNTGLIVKNGRTTVEGYCICPNGRAMRFAVNRRAKEKVS